MLLRAILLVMVVGIPATLRAAEPFARTELVTKGNIVAGQQVEIAVDVFVPNFFKEAPEFPLFDIEDAIVTLPEQRSVNSSETVGDTEYSGIRKSYMVMAQRAGTFALPAIAMHVSYASDEGATTTGTAALPPLEFSVGGVPGDWDGQAPLVATKVSITQELDRDPATAAVGDALVRRVSILADDTQPMMIPVPAFAAPEGTRLYRADPELGQPGSVKEEPDAARRTETITYVAEKAGVVTLPPVDVRWFDPASGKIVTTEAAAIKVTVKDKPGPAQVIPAGSAPQTVDLEAARRAVNQMLFQTVLRALAALILFGLAYYLMSRLSERWADARRVRAESEPAYFKRSRQALAGRDPLFAWRELDTWAARLGFRSISDWVATVQDSDLQAAFSRFSRALFGGQTDVAAARGAMADLAHRLPEARRRAHAEANDNDVTRRALPPLNP